MQKAIIWLILSMILRQSALATKLHDAAKDGYLHRLNWLLDHGTNIEERDANGNTALIVAARNGQVEMVKKLLDRGAYIEGTNNDNNTALMAAANNGRTEVVKELLNRGANINAINNYGHTAVQVASRYSRIDLLGIIRTWSIENQSVISHPTDRVILDGATANSYHTDFTNYGSKAQRKTAIEAVSNIPSSVTDLINQY